MSKKIKTAGRWIRQPIRMIPVLLLALLIPLTVYSEDVNEDMIKEAYRGNIATVKACLERGADVNVKLGDSGWTALILAAGEGHTQMVEVLLANGAEVNAADVLKNTALMRAAQYGYADTVEVLLANGAEMNAKSYFGDTALSRATDNGHTETIRILKKAGAKE